MHHRPASRATLLFALLLLVAAVWWLLPGGGAGREAANEAAAAGAVEAAAAEAGQPAPAPGEIARTETPIGIAAEAASFDGPPDRERELHGFVRDAGGSPIAGAEVVVTRPRRQAGGGLDLEEFRRADEAGRATSRADGEWRCAVEPGSWYDVSAQAPGLAAPLERSCQAGARVDFTLLPAAALAVTVLDAESGAPLAGVPARVFQYGGAGIERKGRTDSAGACRFEGLAAGNWVLELEPPEHQPPGWVDVAIAAGEEAAREFRLPRGVACFGRVTDAASGAGIAGAEVCESWVFDRVVRTDAEGKFRLPGALGEGTARELHARAPGYGRRAIPMPPDLAAEVEIRLTRGRVVSGTVTLADGGPAAGARVAAVTSEHGGEVQQTDWRAADAGPDGRFEIADVRPDLRHALLVRRPGSGQVLYELPPEEMHGERLELGEIRLPAAGTLAGRVTDGAGAGVARCSVRCEGFNADRGRWNPQPLQELDWYVGRLAARTDDLGRFRFTDLAPGTYRLVAERPGWQPTEPLAAALTEGATIAGLELVLARGVRIAGRVLAPGGEPVPRAFVQVHGAGAGQRAPYVRTGADGGFELLGLEPGEYSLSVDAPHDWAQAHEGRRLCPRQLQGIRPEAGELEIVLAHAARISGRVLDDGGRPTSAWVLASRPGGAPLVQAETGADGEFELWVEEGSVVDLRAGPLTPTEGRVVLADDSAHVAEQKGVSAGASGLLLRLPF